MKGVLKMKFYHAETEKIEYVIHVHFDNVDDHHYFSDYEKANKFFHQLRDKYASTRRVRIRLCEFKDNTTILEYNAY